MLLPAVIPLGVGMSGAARGRVDLERESVEDDIAPVDRPRTLGRPDEPPHVELAVLLLVGHHQLGGEFADRRQIGILGAADPAYADKLTRVINTTLRVQRSLG